MNPRMVTLLRESRGMSLSALAAASGVSQPTLSRVEMGRTELDDDRKAAIAEALRYPLVTFDWTDDLYGLGLPAFHHRKQQALGIKVLHKIHAEVNLIRLRVKRLLNGLEFEPRYKIPTLDVEQFGTPEEVARAVRATWKMPMGPVVNMMATVENAGVVVLRADLSSPKISALTIVSPDVSPIIVLNEGMPADRERFTLAHELGHMVMHDSPDSVDEVEREADRFASEFLMPAAEIRGELGQLTLAKAAQLKQRWRVAMSSIIMRAKTLERIDERKAKSLFVQMSQRGWRKAEPYAFEPDEPSLLRDVLDIHRQDNEFSTDELAEMTGLFDDEYVVKFHDHTPGLRAV